MRFYFWLGYFVVALACFPYWIGYAMRRRKELGKGNALLSVIAAFDLSVLWLPVAVVFYVTATLDLGWRCGRPR